MHTFGLAEGGLLFGGRRPELSANAVVNGCDAPWTYFQEVYYVLPGGFGHRYNVRCVARRPARHGGKVEALEGVKCLGVAQEDNVVDGNSGWARRDKGAHVHRAKEYVEAELCRGEGQDSLLPGNTDGSAHGWEEAMGEVEVGRGGKVVRDGSVAGEGSKAGCGAERGQPCEKLVNVAAESGLPVVVRERKQVCVETNMHNVNYNRKRTICTRQSCLNSRNPYCGSFLTT